LGTIADTTSVYSAGGVPLPFILTALKCKIQHRLEDAMKLNFLLELGTAIKRDIVFPTILQIVDEIASPNLSMPKVL
jgi:hypothetical protein